MREECWKDFASLDAEKITPIQTNGGSQYLRKGPGLRTAKIKTGFQLRSNQNMIGFAN